MTVGEGGIAVDLRHEGLGSVLRDYDGAPPNGGLRMTNLAETIRVVIPLTIRKRNGRPKILPPDDIGMQDGRAQDPHVLRAIARAWSWRRQLETAGAASTIHDIAVAEKVSDRFVSRMMRLAYLSPEVLEHLVIGRVPPARSLNDLAGVADRPWLEQMSLVFD